MALQTVPSPASTALQARPDAASATPGYILAGATDISTRLAPETPGCPEMGVSGRLPGHQRVADLEPRAGGPKHQARPRLNNPSARRRRCARRCTCASWTSSAPTTSAAPARPSTGSEPPFPDGVSPPARVPGSP
ncbi:hypothetical protein ACFQU7_21055 [Pseudoroseomonas wenyumeiae]